MVMNNRYATLSTPQTLTTDEFGNNSYQIKKKMITANQ